MQAFAERLVERSRPGRIVIFTSGPPQTGAIAYAASKGALEWITLSAAAELGRFGITVNAVNPGFLLSEDAGFIDGQLITSDGGHGVADGSWPR